MENGVAKRAKVATSRADGQASTTSASGSIAAVIREHQVPQQSQQYSPEELPLPEHQVRMEPRLKNLDYSDPLALEQYQGGSAMFEVLARRFYGRK